MLVNLNPSVLNRAQSVQNAQSNQKAKSPAFQKAITSTDAFNFRDKVAFAVAAEGKEAVFREHKDFIVEAYKDGNKIVRAFLKNVVEMVGQEPEKVFAGIT